MIKYIYEIWESGSCLTSSHDESYDSVEEAEEEASFALESLLDDYECEGLSQEDIEMERKYISIEIKEVYCNEDD